MKVVNLFFIIDLNFSHTLTFVFVAGKYGTIDPIYYFLQFFLTVFYVLLMGLFIRDFAVGLRFELVRLHKMSENVAGL